MKLRTQFLLGYALVFALMIIIAGIATYGLNTLIDTANWVSHTEHTIGEAQAISKLLVDMETGERGFLLTGKDEFLEPYNNGIIEYKVKIEALQKYVSDNPDQVKILQKIDALITRWIEIEAKPEIAERRLVASGESTLDSIIAMETRGKGKELMDELRGHIEEFISVEEALLKSRSKEAKSQSILSSRLVIIGTGTAILLGIVVAFFIIKSVVLQVGGEPAEIMGIAKQVAEGNLNLNPTFIDGNSSGILSSIIAMVASLKKSQSENEKQTWLKTGQAELNDSIRGDLDLMTLVQKGLSFLAPYLGAQVAATYMYDENDEKLRLFGSYGYKERKNLSNEFKVGEGLVGQAALEKQRILISNVPDDYIKVTSGLGESTPKNIAVIPLISNQKLIGAIEFASVEAFTDVRLELLDRVSESLAIAGDSAQARTRMKELLEQTQQQAEELQSQQEELRVANEELEEQTKALKESEGELQSQQEELRVTNEELEERTKALEEQKDAISLKNEELNEARASLEQKARDLSIASKYKSEFLANMSHELRTPLNSILILSQLLAENKTENLTLKQQEFAGTIHSSGSDLLRLINEILDLSKVEAGKIEVTPELVRLSDLVTDLKRNFDEVAEDKKLRFTITLDENSPAEITSDRLRLHQIIRNLLSNAFKFTSEGSVDCTIFSPDASVQYKRDDLQSKPVIAFRVTDTGIGIADNQLDEVFYAFQQADGTTSRKYGGSGLGLSISRELAKLLGGEIHLKSTLGRGSTFTLYLPTNVIAAEINSSPIIDTAHVDTPSKSKINETTEISESISNTIDSDTIFLPDDRNNLEAGDHILLIIEDDPRFAKTLQEVAGEFGFKTIVAGDGESGLSLAWDFKPDAITLDIRLPGMDGFKLMNRLKESPTTAQIPVHFVTVEEREKEGMALGAIGYLTKPVSHEQLTDAFNKIEDIITHKTKRLLLVEDNKTQRQSIIELLRDENVDFVEADTGDNALTILKEQTFDCMILDLGLKGGASGFEILEKIKEEQLARQMQIIVYTGMEITIEQEAKLKEYTETIIVKGVQSPERLLDEARIFLNGIKRKLNKRTPIAPQKLKDRDETLAEKTILVVDDDMRNVFALSSVLESNDIKVVVGRNGIDGIKKLEENPEIDLILMDIMMPEMDGYEAIDKIRQNSKYKSLPIIALTAKAMKGDRQKCIDAGANDYLAKPVENDKLLSLLRVWMS